MAPAANEATCCAGMAEVGTDVSDTEKAVSVTVPRFSTVTIISISSLLPQVAILAGTATAVTARSLTGPPAITSVVVLAELFAVLSSPSTVAALAVRVCVAIVAPVVFQLKFNVVPAPAASAPLLSVWIVPSRLDASVTLNVSVKSPLLVTTTSTAAGSPCVVEAGAVTLFADTSCQVTLDVVEFALSTVLVSPGTVSAVAVNVCRPGEVRILVFQVKSNVVELPATSAPLLRTWIVPSRFEDRVTLNVSVAPPLLETCTETVSEVPCTTVAGAVTEPTATS